MNLPPFKNESYLNFSDERNAQAMMHAIEEVGGVCAVLLFVLWCGLGFVVVLCCCGVREA